MTKLPGADEWFMKVSAEVPIDSTTRQWDSAVAIVETLEQHQSREFRMFPDGEIETVRRVGNVVIKVNSGPIEEEGLNQ